MSGVPVGIGGFSAHFPPWQVRLADWCGWYGQPADRLAERVGDSFRLCSPRENAYTLAASAVLRLIRAYGIDPEAVGMLALGTESSTDNSAGAVIVRGMVDAALDALGMPRLSRACEVHEVKHACLGGVYALKSALRYVATDGRGREAIVVASDVAEYARGSSGEETQGAGAVAMRVVEAPALVAIDLARSGSASDYRGPDFRKPVRRLRLPAYHAADGGLHDFPVFNGRYTTVCYIDEVVQAARHLLSRLGTDARTLYHDVDAIFLHRPYHQMPRNALAALYVWGLQWAPEHRAELEALCRDAGVPFEAVMREIDARPDLFARARDGDVEGGVYAHAMQVTRHFRTTAKFRDDVASRLELGSAAMARCGNLYAAALPAWIAAGLEEAARQGRPLAGRTLLGFGYGSGDAAEAFLMEVAPGWADAAGRIGFEAALAGAVTLDREGYEALHDGRDLPGLEAPRSGTFVIDRIGATAGTGLQDVGMEYYRFVP